MENSASEADGDEEKKKLYVFLSHHLGSPYVHTLYALQIPNPNGPTPPEVEEEKLVPNLSLTMEEYGREMCCANLGSILYFIGGVSRHPIEHSLVYHKEVYTLDTAAAGEFPPPGTPPEHNSRFLIPGPSMNTGKVEEALAFVAYGKIFVLSGPTLDTPESETLIPFEMFTPGGSSSSGITAGVWERLPDPPFTDIASAYVVIKGKLFFYLDYDKTIYIFDMASKVWKQRVEHSFPFAEAAMVVEKENKMYTCPNPFFGSVVSHSLDLSTTITGSNGLVPLHLGETVLEEVKSSFHSWIPCAYLADVGNGRFCFLRVGCAPNPFDASDFCLYDSDKCFMDIALYDSSIDKLLTCAGFTLDPFNAPTTVVAAIAV